MYQRLKLLLLAIFAASLLSNFATTSDAEAQSRTCRALQKQLANLDGRSAKRNTGSREYRRYSDAIRKQRIEISKVTKSASRSGCIRGGVFKSRSSQCKRLAQSLRKMQKNQRRLEQTRNKHAPRQANNSRKRRTILARLERRGCNAPTQQQASKKPNRNDRKRTIVEQVFGVSTYDDSGTINNEVAKIKTKLVYGSTFRTLCVRRSDGYYFPISFSTTKKYFDRDEDRCREMCPGVDVALYHHRMPGEDSEAMIAAETKTPYNKEPFAFAYRRDVKKGLQCKYALREDFASNSGNQNTRSRLSENSYVGIPEFKTDRTFSPDDTSLARSNLSLEKIENILIAANAPETGTQMAREQTEKNIRIVGPAFFPVQ